MTKNLVSTVIAGLLLTAGAALAQPQDNHMPGGNRDRQQRSAPAAAPAAAPPAAAAPANPAAFGTFPAPGAPPVANDRRGDNRPTQQAAPQAAAPAARNDQRGRDNDQRGSSFNNRDNGRDFNNNRNSFDDRARNTRNNNFSSYQRNYRAPQRFRAPTYNRPRGWYDHRWTFGEILPSLFWAQNYWLTDYQYYRLTPPPPGTVWVRDGYDALLIDRYDGQIIQVAYDVFY